MGKPVLHLPVCFHMVPNYESSHCAFVSKCLKFPRAMQPLGWDIVEYSNGDSESVCHQKVQILTEDELERLAGKHADTAFYGATAVIGSPHWTEFDKRLRVELTKRVKPGDFILHPFGRSHSGLVQDFPKQRHAELLGIGYPDKPFGAYRVFESSAWAHYHAGQHLNFDSEGRVIYQGNLPSMGKNGNNFQDWVCPNYFEVDQWTPQYEPGKYIVFMGRICSEKGLDIIKAIAENIDEKIIVAGQGSIEQWKHSNIDYVGPVSGRARDAFLGNAKVMLMPTSFIEPFAGSGVESQLVGTPLLCSDWGAFHETVEHGKTGFRCRVLGDWLEGIRRAPSLDRKYISDRARRIYCLEACGVTMDKILRQIMTLDGEGWYSKDSIWV